MLAIIAHHFSVHGGFNFPVSSITFNRLWQQFILMGGGLGNCIFVMLSGYFLINSKGLSFRKLFNLWTRIFFWSVTIYCVFVLSGHEVFALKSTLKALLPVTRRQWWFASTYFVMYLIHPYVNKFLHGLTREEYKKFLLSVMILWCIIPTLTKSDFGANPTINFVCIYSLAGYVRLYGDDFVERKYILWALAFIGLNFLSAIVIDVIGLKFSFVKSRSYSYMFSMMRPFTIAATVCLLLGFRNFNIPHNSVVNTVASATFGVYLIHDSNLVRPFLWFEIFQNASFQDSPYLALYSLGAIIIVYVSCTILELLRQKAFSILPFDFF